ncbi:MAG: hypothetical protein ABI035_12855 [Gemmatimonadaceae bacterium]
MSSSLVFTRGLGAGALLAASLLGCRPSATPAVGPSPASAAHANGTTVTVTRVEVPTPTDPMAIGVKRISAVTAAARSLRLDPDSVLLRVGESYDLNRVRVYALDDATRVLGWYIMVNRSIPYGVIQGVADGRIVAARPGRDSVTERAPMWDEFGGVGPVPTAYLRFIVRP